MGKTLRIEIGIALLLGSSLAGCPESVSEPPDSGRVDASVSPMEDAGPTPVDAGPTPVDAGPSPVDAGPAPDGGGEGRVVVTEIQPRGLDWAEIYNPTATPMSLADLFFTDADDEGVPRDDHLTAFPADLVLAPGERFLVVCEPDPAIEGVVSDAACQVDGYIGRCVGSCDFGIGAAGDGFFVVRVAGDVVETIVDGYAFDASTEGVDRLPSDRTWCRIPDDGGAVVVCAATPGAPNEAMPLP